MSDITVKTRPGDYEEKELGDPKILDSIQLNKKEYNIGMVKFLIYTAIAILVFFIPVEIGSKSGILFGIIYNGIIDILGTFGLWLVTAVIAGNGILSFYGKFIAKEGKIHEYYKTDSVFHPFLYSLGGLFIVLYSLTVTTSFVGPEIIVGEVTGGMVIPDIVLGVAWIIPVGAFFIPFLLDYGSIDFLGVLLEPLMRPIFKVPGKSAVDAVTSFVGSTSMAVIVTSRLHKNNTYTKKEAAIIASCFSAVSVGYALVVMTTAGIAEYFIPTYFISFLIAFLIAIVVVRIPPLSKKPDVYYDGRVQTEEDIKEDAKYEKGVFRKGLNRAVKRAYTSGNINRRIIDSLLDGGVVIPKVISLLCSIGILGMIVARYTPFFDWVGLIFLPLISLVGVPDAAAAAGAIPAGITEMFLPVLVIADQVDVLHAGTRFFVTVVSMVQIIFFAETVVVITSTGIPLKIKELVVIFLQRTFLAIPFAALFMHLLF